MTGYSGHGGLDAEITLNLVEGSITMDYSLNKFGNPLDSNRSVVLNSTFRKLPPKTQLLEILATAGTGMLGLLGVMFFVPVFTVLVQHKIIKNPRYHYQYQKLLKWYMIRAFGIFEQSHSGPSDNKLSFFIEKNIWLSYELSGEYQEKIKTVSLKRNFVHLLKFGKFPQEKQYGWNVMFEFTEPMTSGSCTIRYV